MRSSEGYCERWLVRESEEVARLNGLNRKRCLTPTLSGLAVQVD